MKSKRSVFIVAVVAVISMALIGFFYFLSVHALKKEVALRGEENAVYIMSKVSAFVSERYHDLPTILSQVPYKNGVIDVYDVTRHLLKHRNNFTCYTSISFYDMSGKRLADSSGLGIGLVEAHRQFFQDAVKYGSSTGREAAISVTDNFPSIYFSYLVKDELNTPVGVVVARVPLYYIGAIASEAIPDSYKGRFKFDLIGKDGLIYYSSRKGVNFLKDRFGYEEVLAAIRSGKKSGFIQRHGEDRPSDAAREDFYAFAVDPAKALYPSNGWALILFISSDYTRQLLWPLRWRFILIFFIVFSLFVFLLVNFLRVLRHSRQESDDQRKRSGALEDMVRERTAQLESALREIRERQRATLSILEDVNDSRNELETANKRLEQARIQLEAFYKSIEAIIENMPDGVLMVNNRREVLVANRLAKELLGLTGNDIVVFSDVEKILKGIAWNDLLGGAWEDELVTKDVTVNTVQGDVVLRVDANRIKSNGGGVSGIVVLLSDVTRERAVSRMKDDFVGAVSHELRTPLTPMREAVTQIYEGHWGPITDKQKRFLNITINNIDRLTRIINDLLDISKIESGKLSLHWERIDLRQIVESVQGMFDSQARAQGIEFLSFYREDPLYVYGDKDRITQVFVNLLNNAFKFTEKGRIKIFLEKKSDAIECTVSDTGIGISKSDLKRLFNKFEQFGRRDGPGIKGTGLGLAITRGIIELHGGKIWAQSVLGVGSEFIFSLTSYNELVLLFKSIDDRLLLARRDNREEFLFLLRWKNIEGLTKENGVDALKSLSDNVVAGFEDVLGYYGQVYNNDYEEIICLCDARYGMDDVVRGLVAAVKSALFVLPEGSDIGFTYGLAVYPHGGFTAQELRDKAIEASIDYRREQSSRMIMLVDDEPSVTSALVRMLGRHGYVNTLEVNEGGNAVEAAQKMIPDLIMLDVNMPDLNGYEIIGRLKRDRRTKDIPVVLMSGYEMDGKRIEEHSSDMTVYVVAKPFDEKEIFKVLDYLL